MSPNFFLQISNFYTNNIRVRLNSRLECDREFRENYRTAKNTAYTVSGSSAGSTKSNIHIISSN